ncbi:MAG: hypothetical protein GHCLOJNM_00374 [bacterium]|nr:hypothetical protein [bacterium]
MKTTLKRLIAAILIMGSVCSDSFGGIPTVADYPSIQAALDANPGQMVLVPDGDHLIQKKIRISRDGSGLYGYGRILQEDPEQPILEIEGAEGVRVCDLTFSRAEGKQEARAPGVLILDCTDTLLDGVRVLDNHASEGSIDLRDCVRCIVRDCEVTNYKRITVDDRTESDLYGYAFHAIDGHGILVRFSQGTRVTDNRVVENRLLPTPEIKEKHNLGQLTPGKKPNHVGELASDVFRRGSVTNWHQGSAIMVSSPESTDHTIITGNYIENCAQGIDIHSDHVICSRNIVKCGMMGVKATHGSRNLIITENQLNRIDLWGIILNPGALSHAAEAASEGKSQRAANVDGGTIIAENIISDYGYGHEYWNWGGASEDKKGSYAIALYEGQLPTNPPLRDVLIQGNVVYDHGRDQILVDGEPKVAPPRYRYAIYVGPWGESNEKGPTYPTGIRFEGNLLHPGLAGISNVELTP